eukprot:2874942-Rhodomonas_salina.1
MSVPDTPLAVRKEEKADRCQYHTPHGTTRGDNTEAYASTQHPMGQYGGDGGGSLPPSAAIDKGSWAVCRGNAAVYSSCVLCWYQTPHRATGET